MPLNLNVGDTVELKKQHACGCKEFQIKCKNCGRLIMLDRPTLEKRTKKVIPKGE